MFKFNNKTSEQLHWHHCGVSIINIEHIPHLILVFLLLTLNRELYAGEAEKKT